MAHNDDIHNVDRHYQVIFIIWLTGDVGDFGSSKMFHGNERI